MFPIYTHKLQNGLGSVIVPIDKAPLVSINLAYKAGSKNEEKHMTGIAHLFEHLMFEGSKHVPKGDFDKYCSMAGGTNNAYTSFDLTSYNMTLPKHQLELGLWLESDRMLEFSVSEESLRTQQKVVSEEIFQTVHNQPYGRWRELLSGTAFSEDCSYSWEVHGNHKHVLACDLDYLKKFFARYYQPDNACLVLCGDIDPKSGKDQVEKYFSEIPVLNGRKQHIHNEKECKKGDRSVVFYDNIPMSAVFIAYHCPGFKDDDIFKADIISNLFGNGRHSKLYDLLVDDLEIASYTGSFMDAREDASLIIFFAIAASDDISPELLKEKIYTSFDDFLENGIMESEFEKSINQLTTKLAYEFQYNSSIADIIANQMLFWDDPERIYRLLDIYKNLKIDEINDFSRKILTRENRVEVIAMPHNSK
mgnify:CR=1 FL=1